MSRVIVSIVLLACVCASAACTDKNGNLKKVVSFDLGVLPVGGVPNDMSIFVSSDCGKVQPKFADCSAQDAYGRSYDFFNGALSRVSANKDEVTKELQLPAGILFGEDVESAAKKVAERINIKLQRGTSSSGQVVYSSDYVVRSSAGIDYSIELTADAKGHLAEVVERTDF